jgi:hypothetical protein
MKQKLAVLAALVPDVDLYLLDEPDRALDASMRFRLREVLSSMKRQGKTIVLSSHHLGEVEALADRLEFLLDGSFVPAERLRSARARLRQQPRVRLRDGAALPAGARQLMQEPDGTLVVETEGDPMQWLRGTPPGAVDSAEIGKWAQRREVQKRFEPIGPRIQTRAHHHHLPDACRRRLTRHSIDVAGAQPSVIHQPAARSSNQLCRHRAAPRQTRDPRQPARRVRRREQRRESVHIASDRRHALTRKVARGADDGRGSARKIRAHLISFGSG